MSQTAIEMFLGKLLTDEDFRAKALEDLLEACYEKGLIFTPVELRAIAEIDIEKFGEFSRFIDDSIKRYSPAMSAREG